MQETINLTFRFIIAGLLLLLGPTLFATNSEPPLENRGEAESANSSTEQTTPSTKSQGPEDFAKEAASEPDVENQIESDTRNQSPEVEVKRPEPLAAEPTPEPVSADQAYTELAESAKRSDIDSQTLSTLQRKLSLLQSLNNPERPLVVGISGMSNSGVSEAFNKIAQDAVNEDMVVSPTSIKPQTSKNSFAYVPVDVSSDVLNETFGGEFTLIKAKNSSGVSSVNKKPILYWQHWEQPFVMVDIPGVDEAKDIPTSLEEVNKSAKFCDIIVSNIPANYLSQNYLAFLKKITTNGSKIILSISVDQYEEAGVKDLFAIFHEIEAAAKIHSEKKIIIERAPTAIAEAGANEPELTQVPPIVREVKAATFSLIWGESATQVAILEEIPTIKPPTPPTRKELEKTLIALEKEVDRYITVMEKLEKSLDISEKEFNKHYDVKKSGVYERIDHIWKNNSKKIKILKVPVGWIVKILEMNSRHRHKIEGAHVEKTKLISDTKHKTEFLELLQLSDLIHQKLQVLVDIKGSMRLPAETQQVLEKSLNDLALIGVQPEFLKFYGAQPKLAPRLDRHIKASLLIMKRDKPMAYYGVLIFGDLGYKLLSKALGVGGPLAAAYSTPWLVPIATLGSYAAWAPIFYPILAGGVGIGTFMAYWYGKSKTDHVVDYARIRLFLAGYLPDVFEKQKRWRRDWLVDWLKKHYEPVAIQAKRGRESLEEAKTKIAQMRVSCKNSFKK